MFGCKQTVTLKRWSHLPNYTAPQTTRLKSWYVLPWKLTTTGWRHHGVTLHEAWGTLSDVSWDEIIEKNVWFNTGMAAFGEDVTVNYTHCITKQNWHQLQVARLRWAGHAQCIAKQQMPKKSLYAKISWKRKVKTKIKIVWWSSWRSKEAGDRSLVRRCWQKGVEGTPIGSQDS